jgi:hypothetical protein
MVTPHLCSMVKPPPLQYDVTDNQHLSRLASQLLKVGPSPREFDILPAPASATSPPAISHSKMSAMTKGIQELKARVEALQRQQQVTERRPSSSRD